MDAFDFVMNYRKFLKEIENVIKPELLPVFEKLKQVDPTDLITPDTFFVSDSHSRGFVWSLFLLEVRKSQN